MNKEFLKMQKLAGLITEGQYKEKLNEDNLEVKKAAKDLYTFLKKNGVVVKLDTVSPTSSKYKSVGNQDPKTNQAYIFYFDQGGQTKIHVRLTGPENDIKNIESKFFSAYPNLEQVNRMIELGWTKGIVNVDFEVKEKMTKKGGLAGNTNVNEAEEKTIQTYGPNLVNMLKQNGFDTKFTTNDSEYTKAQELAKTSDKKLAVVYYNTRQFISVTTNEKNRDEAFKIITSPAVERLLPDGYKAQTQGGYFIQIQKLS